MCKQAAENEACVDVPMLPSALQRCQQSFTFVNVFLQKFVLFLNNLLQLELNDNVVFKRGVFVKEYKLQIRTPCYTHTNPQDISVAIAKHSQ